MESVTEKFLRYVKVDTQSDELSETFPSTKKQFNLAGMLVEELKNMGVSEKYPQIQRKQIIHAMQTVHACQKLQV